MRRVTLSLMIIFGALSLSISAYANRYWPSVVLTNWEVYLNNGVAYIASPQFASHCSYSRGHILMDGTEFNKAQYAYAISAKARGKNLKYVVDNTHGNCVISGLQELD